MKRIGVTELSELDIDAIMADYYLLERLSADGSRSAKLAQRKLESYAAPRLMRYIAAICGGEMRHAGNTGEGCEGYECNGENSDQWCECCGEEIDSSYHEPDDECDECHEPESAHDCDHEDEEDCTEACDHEFYATPYCDCPCPGYMCGMCEEAQDGGLIIDDLNHHLRDWVQSLGWSDGHGRDGAWREFLEFHDEHGAKALKWLEEGFEAYGWPGGYGGDSWAFIARVAYEYQSGKMTAHAFMDRVWTLHHNGGNIFDKMFDPYRLDKLLREQARDNYGYLARVASREVRDLWVIRPYVLSDSLDRDPAWLGREIPTGVEW